MIYDYQLVSVPSENDTYEVGSGRMLVFPFTLSEGQQLTIYSQHILAGSQDHSLRIWVSDQIDGRYFTTRSDSGYWHPNRTPGENIIVYDKNIDAPVGSVLPLEPGDYYINVLNLVNSRNAFYLKTA